MKIKTSELTGAALDWAVAKCLGLELHKDAILDGILMPGWHASGIHGDRNQWARLGQLHYSTDWCWGGPIIEREKITLVCAEGDYAPDKAGTSYCFNTYWVAEIGRQNASTTYGSQGDDHGVMFQIAEDNIQGPTPLIAAMRCYVNRKLGATVDIPEELI